MTATEPAPPDHDYDVADLDDPARLDAILDRPTIGAVQRAHNGHLAAYARHRRGQTQALTDARDAVARCLLACLDHGPRTRWTVDDLRRAANRLRNTAITVEDAADWWDHHAMRLAELDANTEEAA